MSEKRPDVTQARADELMKTLEAISAQIELLNGHDPSDTKAAEARESLVKNYRSVRGLLKTMHTNRKKRDQEAFAETETVDRLTELIEGAEEGLDTSPKRGMFCGGARWTRWAQKKWLPP